MRALMIILGLILLVIGVLAVIPSVGISGAAWFNWVVLVVGLIVLIGAAGNKKE
jgi:uncharacterized membrane protein